jgi:hypothetical protein
MMLVIRWLRSFGRFWYDFVVGEDWVVAATVASALFAVWLLHRANVSAWWMLPAAAVAVAGLSLRRTMR